MAEKRPFRACPGDKPYVFVSYSHRDSAAVYGIIDRLFQSGYNLWYDQGIPNNAVLDMEIATRIRRCELFMVFLSPASAASEYVVGKELPLAVERSKRLLFVRLDPNDDADYSALTGGAGIISPAEIAACLPRSCRECEHRDPQPIEVDVSVGIEVITDELSGFTYVLSNGGLIITALTGSRRDEESEGEPEFGEDIVVPARHNGFPVVGIAPSAFEDVTLQSGYYDCALSSVTLPDTITELGDAAFCDSTIERINLPAYLTAIGLDCFSDCHYLARVDMPYGLKIIDDTAFFQCDALEEIIVPETVASIGAQAFDGCDALERIVIPPGAAELGNDIFGCIFDEYDPDEPEEWGEGELRITCVKDSPIHKYAQRCDLPVQLVSETEMDGYMRPMREAYMAKKRAVEAEDAANARAAAEEAAAHGVCAAGLPTADEQRA